MAFYTSKLNKPQQYLAVLVWVGLVSAVCYALSGYIGYRVVALLLLFSVSVVAMFFRIFPVLVAAVSSALIWDFFFIPPRFTFLIGSTEDILMFLMYFVIALVNAVLTFKIRQVEKEWQKREEKVATIKLYNTMLNSLSHELRTPISTIVAASDNLQSNKLSESNKQKLIQEISMAGLRLNRQLENLLNMSRLESGVVSPKLDWCDMHELINGVVNQLKELAKGHLLKLEIADEIPLCKLDYGLMEQVLYNLLLNAVHYTPSGTKITISAQCRQQVLTIIVEDNGPGFPLNEHEKVFEKFYRLPNARSGGTGLGLSIVKGFVEAHQGTVTLENSAIGGAKFSINIPTEASYLTTVNNE